MSTRNQNIWIPFTDSMTALMLIFLLIVVLIFSLIPKQQDVLSPTEVKLEEFEVILDELYQELYAAFKDKHDEWGIRVLKDSTIKFENPVILFDRDSATLKNEFEEILDEFIPKYLSIVGKEKYEGKIKEIRIEGHTAAVSQIHDTYIKTIDLSQERARHILEYILYNPYFANLAEREQEKFIFLMSANGFGYGRAIDSTYKFVYNTNKPISPNSRRVEFKVVTNSDELVKQLVEKR